MDIIPFCTTEDDYLYPLPANAVEWIRYYCNDIYVYHTPTFRLPYPIVRDLSRVKRCGITRVYRGMSFGILNADKLVAFAENIDPYSITLNIDSYLPISTSVDITVASNFAATGAVGLLLELDAEEGDVLVDLTLLNNNESVPPTTYIQGEQEVILLPGSYSFTVANYESLLIPDILYTNLLYLQQTLSPFFREGKILNSVLKYNGGGVTSIGNTFMVVIPSFVALALAVMSIEDSADLPLASGNVIVTTAYPYTVTGREEVLEFLRDYAEVLFS